MPTNNSAPNNGLNDEKITGEIFTDEATREKIHTHIINPLDTITDQDLLNVKTVMTPASLAEEKKAAEEAGIDIPGDGL